MSEQAGVQRSEPATEASGRGGRGSIRGSSVGVDDGASAGVGASIGIGVVAAVLLHALPLIEECALGLVREVVLAGLDHLRHRAEHLEDLLLMRLDERVSRYLELLHV